MTNLNTEKEFFHFIAKRLCEFISNNETGNSIVNHKGEGDFSTQIDVSVENIIVDEIKKRFPGDQILAEEGYSNSKILDDRIWIIDPICGTNNLARNIKNFCTNIALIENNKVIASCVIDYSNNDYYWSVGEGKVFCNDALFSSYEKRFDTMIDIDYGAILSLGKDRKEKYIRFSGELITNTNYYLMSLNSSLSFAYVAIGKVDGFFNIYNKPWDICASSFLIQQSGGIITDLEGNLWTVLSVGAVAAKNKELHQKLLTTFLNS